MEEINIKVLFEFFLSKIIIIILGTTIAILIGIVYTMFFQEPIYQSTAVILTGIVESDEIVESNLELNSKLITTYTEIIKSKTVLKNVIDTLELECTVQELKDEIDVSKIANTDMISITVKSNEAQKAALIANEIATKFIEQIKKIYNIENVDIIDKAEVESNPIDTNKANSIVTYALIGLTLSVVMVFIIFYLDTTLKCESQIEELGLTVLATIPQNIKKEGKRMNDILTYKNSNPVVSENIKMLHANLQLINKEENIKTIMITSSVQKEGKNFVAANLAITFTQLGKKVLVVDCDMRCGVQHKLFNLTNENGLANLLMDNTKNKIDYKKYIKLTEIPNLYVITSGIIPPNPSELLSSKIFEEFVIDVKQEYDLVVFVLSPVTVVADALIVAGKVDKTVIVTRIRTTPIEELEKTKKMLENIGGNIAGVVVTGAKNPKKKNYNEYYN